MAKAKSSGLGRGLDSLFYESAPKNEEKSPLNTLKITEVAPRSGQPRKDFDPEGLAELSASIAKHGLIQPIIVRRGEGGFYEIIAGERRWRASKMAGLTEIPVIIIEANDQKKAVGKLQQTDGVCNRRTALGNACGQLLLGQSVPFH